VENVESPSAPEFCDTDKRLSRPSFVVGTAKAVAIIAVASFLVACDPRVTTGNQTGPAQPTAMPGKSASCIVCQAMITPIPTPTGSGD